MQTMKGIAGVCGRLALAGMLVAGAGCATSGGGKSTAGEKAKEPPKKQKVDLDPMLVRGGDAEAPKTVDSKEVFDQAYEAYSARRYEEAIDHYETIVRYFQESRFFRPSLYNGGLAYEKLGRWKSAARMYRAILEEFPEKENTADAYYRLAHVYKKLGKHQKIVELMTQVMLRDGVTAFDRIEAHTRRSNALIELGQLKEAEQGFRNLLEINRKAPSDERLPTNSRYICQAYFGLGRVFHERQSEIPLKLPPENMGDDLDKKGKLLLSAQRYYLDALRQHHPHWSMAAGYMIGRLYEDFYSDIFSAEVPDGLSDEQVAMYFEELRNKIRPLMKRALDVYERNLSLSKKIGETPENNKWVAETSESLRRIKIYLNNPVTQKQAERLALEGKDFRKLWRTWELAGNQVEKAVERAKKKSAAAGR